MPRRAGKISWTPGALLGLLMMTVAVPSAAAEPRPREARELPRLERTTAREAQAAQGAKK